MKVGEIYRYGRPYNPNNPIKDGLMNYFYVTYCKGYPLPLLEKGINPIANVKAVDGNRTPAILISSSPHKTGTSSTPWQDFFDPDNGHVRYFGDNRTTGKNPNETEGNSYLLKAYETHNSLDCNIRKASIPILFFKRVRVGNRIKGNVQFQGYGVIERIERVIQFDVKTRSPFVNYVYDLTVLALMNEQETFNWKWIEDRRNPNLPIEETLKFAPETWKQWIKDGPKIRERVRRRVSKLLITKAETQKPSTDSIEQKVLKQIYDFYDKKSRFELLASKVTARILDSQNGRYKEGWITPPSADGGTDFISRLDLGSDFSTVKLIILGQAKCQDPSKPISGAHIARTVARLRRGWIGAFVTTSFFSEPVQREIIDDEYPILLINGQRLAREVIKMTFEQGYFDVRDFLINLDKDYESQIMSRRPEEILYED